MTEQYAGALLYLVPVIVAAIVAFVVTRPEKSEPASPAPAPTPARRIPAQRSYTSPASYSTSPFGPVQVYGPGPGSRRSTPTPPQSPTLLHAALSSHLAAVAGSTTSSTAPLSAKQPVVRPSRLVSIRRPARIPRRPLHRCPHKPA